MENLIKTSSDIAVTYTQKDTYLYDVVISGNIKGKTFGYFMYGSNKNNGGISSYFKSSGGTTNKVNCEVTNSSWYQYQNSNSGYDCWMGGGLQFTSNNASLTFSLGPSYIFSTYKLFFINKGE